MSGTVNLGRTTLPPPQPLGLILPAVIPPEGELLPTEPIQLPEGLSPLDLVNLVLQKLNQNETRMRAAELSIARSAEKFKVVTEGFAGFNTIALDVIHDLNDNIRLNEENLRASLAERQLQGAVAGGFAGLALGALAVPVAIAVPALAPVIAKLGGLIWPIALGTGAGLGIGLGVAGGTIRHSLEKSTEKSIESIKKLKEKSEEMQKKMTQIDSLLKA
jgi:hypothetical protein